MLGVLSRLLVANYGMNLLTPMADSLRQFSPAGGSRCRCFQAFVQRVLNLQMN
jgi:hypothetical protein